MTVNDYILQKFQTFGVNLSEADLFDICLNAKISGGGEMNEDCQTRVSVAIAKFIPSLLLRATSISESGFLCLGTFKALRITIHFCASGTV